jgi:hypothetical protein
MAFPVNGLLDTFDRSNESPPITGWADIVAGLAVSANTAVPSGAGTRISHWGTILTDADGEVYLTIATVPANNRSAYVLARITNISGSSFDGYGLRLNKTTGTDNLQVVRVDAGVETVLGANISQEVGAGHKIGLEIVADLLTVYLDVGSGWTAVTTRTDATYGAAGYIGAALSGGAINDFGRGASWRLPVAATF